MCKFASAIMSRTGEMYFNPFTDSLTDLIDLYNIKEGKAGDNFVRLEFTPNGEKYADPDSYTLQVDEPSIPAWFDADKR